MRSHPEVRAQPWFRGAGAAPALGSSAGRAPACPGVRVISCSMGCIPATSSEAQAATLRLESKSLLSHLNSFKYYFFFLPFDLLSIDLLPDQTIEVEAMAWFVCVSSVVSVYLSWEDSRACLSSVDATQNLPEQKQVLWG